LLLEDDETRRLAEAFAAPVTRRTKPTADVDVMPIGLSRQTQPLMGRPLRRDLAKAVVTIF
jgi:hypothetical protein